MGEAGKFSDPSLFIIYFCFGPPSFIIIFFVEPPPSLPYPLLNFCLDPPPPDFFFCHPLPYPFKWDSHQHLFPARIFSLPDLQNIFHDEEQTDIKPVSLSNRHCIFKFPTSEIDTCQCGHLRVARFIAKVQLYFYMKVECLFQTLPIWIGLAGVSCCTIPSITVGAAPLRTPLTNQTTNFHECSQELANKSL